MKRKLKLKKPRSNDSVMRLIRRRDLLKMQMQEYKLSGFTFPAKLKNDLEDIENALRKKNVQD